MIPLFLPTREARMRGLDERPDSLFSYVDLDDRVNPEGLRSRWCSATFVAKLWFALN